MLQRPRFHVPLFEACKARLLLANAALSSGLTRGQWGEYANAACAGLGAYSTTAISSRFLSSQPAGCLGAHAMAVCTHQMYPTFGGVTRRAAVGSAPLSSGDAY